jgi:hypothetical protein
MGYECDFNSKVCEGDNAICNFGVCENIYSKAGDMCTSEEEC